MDIDRMAIRGLERRMLGKLSQRANVPGLRQLAIHVILLVASGLLVWSCPGSAWLVGAIVVDGIVLNCLFCALHESIHRTAFASRWLNEVVGFVCGALLLLPPKYFRLFHFAHHRHTQDPLQDPELAQAGIVSRSAYLWRVSGLPYWHDRITRTLRHAFTGDVPEDFVPVAKRRLVVREARTLWSSYVAVLLLSLLLRSPGALLYWVLPALAGQPFLRLFLLAEHTGCALSEDMFANTRTTYTNAVVRLLTWGMSYHVEHHTFPSVPFHALARVNMLVREHIVFAAPGYLAFHRGLLRQFRRCGTDA